MKKTLTLHHFARKVLDPYSGVFSNLGPLLVAPRSCWSVGVYTSRRFYYEHEGDAQHKPNPPCRALFAFSRAQPSVR